MSSATGSSATGTSPGSEITPPGTAQQSVQRARHAASTARQAAATRAQQARTERELFAQPVQDYLYQALGRPRVVRRAGCRPPMSELGLERLRDSAYHIMLTPIAQDDPLSRAILVD